MDLFQPDKTSILIYSPWPQVKTNSREYILWPVFAYKVLAPKPVNRMLNIFQKAVLGLCKAELLELNSIASKLHLDVEIVRHVLDELMQKGLIESNNKITTNGITLLKKDGGQLPEEIISAYVFQDPWTGQLWPRIIDLKPAKFKFKEGSHFPTIVLGTEGNSKEKSPFVKRGTNIVPNRPSINEIIQASRIHRRNQKINQIYEFDDAEDTYDEFESPTDFGNADFQQIEVISDQPTPYFVVANIYMASGFSNKWYVWDPIGLSSSAWLKRWMEDQATKDSNFQNFLDKLASKLQVDGLTSEESPSIEENLKEEIDSRLGHNAGSYLLYDRLLHMEYVFWEIQKSGSHRGKKEEFMVVVGKVMENLLGQINKSFSRSDGWKIYDFTDKDKRHKVLLEITASLGFSKDLPYGLSSPRGEEIKRAMQNNGGELGSRIVATILLARGEPIHPLRNIAKHIPDFFNKIAVLKNLRNKSAHDSQDEVTGDQVVQQREFIYQVIKLLPESLLLI